jgi:polysaccharide export outer membrane protein
LELRGGDVLHVPLRHPESFFVVGAVQRPGKLEIEPRQPVLVSQAIAMAGGLQKTAKSGDGLILRYDEAGARQELRADIGAILRGKAPDFLIKPDDIIFVPGSATKSLGYSMLNLVPLVVTTVVVP